MVGTVLDITRRRADEARLQMHAFALDTITDPVSVIDEHRVYLLVNQAWTRSAGLSADQVAGVLALSREVIEQVLAESHPSDATFRKRRERAMTRLRAFLREIHGT